MSQVAGCMRAMSIHDASLARTMASQHGIITADQAHALGLSHREVGWRLEQGVLLSLHRGVYRQAAASSTRSARLHAAVLACGPSAVASHRSAAQLHKLREVPGWRSEVTLAGTRLPLLRGVTIHRTDTMDPVDITSVDRTPVTTIPRTLLDLGAVVPFEVVELAAQDAIIQERESPPPTSSVSSNGSAGGDGEGPPPFGPLYEQAFPARGSRACWSSICNGSPRRARFPDPSSSTRSWWQGSDVASTVLGQTYASWPRRTAGAGIPLGKTSSGTWLASGRSRRRDGTTIATGGTMFTCAQARSWRRSPPWCPLHSAPALDLCRYMHMECR